MISDFLSAEDLQSTHRLQLFARQVVEGFCAGLHRSPHRGSSVEFKQHRHYVAGDEIRQLDWKVFGKTDRFYIREYEEETNLRATVLLDCSGSMAYGAKTGTGEKLSKHEYAVRLAACLSHLMLAQQVSVGLVTFDEKVRRIIPSRSRPNHLRALMEEMRTTEPGGESELGRVFADVAPKLKRRGLIVIVSDCFSDIERLRRGLAHLRQARHEIIILQVWDRDELEFPFRQWTRFDCLEQSHLRRVVDPSQLRTRYLERVEGFRDQLRRVCNRHRIDLLPLTTDQPFAEALSQYLATRLRKR